MSNTTIYVSYERCENHEYRSISIALLTNGFMVSKPLDRAFATNFIKKEMYLKNFLDNFLAFIRIRELKLVRDRA